MPSIITDKSKERKKRLKADKGYYKVSTTPSDVTNFKK